MGRYIDAERLKQILKPKEWGTPDERWIPEHEIGAMLDYFPAADVQEVRHGRWVIEKKMFPYIYPKWSCSECGEETTETTGWGTKPRYNYCPNCGAKMDEEEER